MNPGEFSPTPPSQEQLPHLEDEEVVAITVLRDTVAAELAARREQGEKISITLVAIDTQGTIVHIAESQSNLDEYFTVRTGSVADLAQGVPVKTEVHPYGRLRGSGTPIGLEDGSLIFMPGPGGENKPPTLNGEPLYKLGPDDRPLPLPDPNAPRSSIMDAYQPPPPPPPPRSRGPNITHRT